MTGKKFVATATDSIKLDGQTVTASSSGASVALNSKATIQGSRVHLQGGSGSSSDKKTVTTITLTDQDGKPLGDQRALLRKGGDGGQERMVILDAKGATDVTGEDALDVTFPDVTVGKPARGGPMAPHVVAQGETLASLAGRLDADPKTIWNDPCNEALRKSRADRNILAPGDVLYLPNAKKTWKTLSIGSTNSFTANVPTVKVTVLLAWDGKVRANEPYRVIAGPIETTGTTDGSGRVSFTVPVSLTQATVVLVSSRVHFPINIGHLDPVSSASGVTQRLSHLGHLPSNATASSISPEESLMRAIARFQALQGLSVTGRIDPATKEALIAAHGC